MEYTPSKPTPIRRPTLCLLPGLDGTGKLFAPLIEALDTNFDIIVVAYDRATTFPEYVAEAAAQIPTDAPVVFIAESFSGPIAIELMATGNFDLCPSALCATFTKPPLAELLKLVQRIPSGFLRSNVIRDRLARLVLLNGFADKCSANNLMDIISEVSAEKFKERLAILSKVDVTGRMKHVRTPILYIRAARDRLVAPRYGAMIAAQTPVVRLARVEGPHLILQCAAQECAGLIREHVMADHRTDR